MKAGKISILLLLGVFLVFTACIKDIIGTEIPADKRVPLVKGSPQTGKWEAFEYAMDYEYLYTQPKEGTLGSMDFSGSIKKTPGGLDSLAIWIYLLDGNGRVVEIKSIYDSGFKTKKHVRGPFTVTLAISPETAGISFAHTAQLSRGRR